MICSIVITERQNGVRIAKPQSEWDAFSLTWSRQFSQEFGEVLFIHFA
jgi:hypothetical protein